MGATAVTIAGDTSSLTIDLQPTSIVRGRIAAATGQVGREEFVVTPERADDLPEGVLSLNVVAQTGNFEIQGVPAGVYAPSIMAAGRKVVPVAWAVGNKPIDKLIVSAQPFAGLTAVIGSRHWGSEPGNRAS